MYNFIIVITIIKNKFKTNIRLISHNKNVIKKYVLCMYVYATFI